MNLQEAREIIDYFENGKALPLVRRAGKNSFAQAKLYLEALNGPEVGALVEALEKIKTRVEMFKPPFNRGGRVVTRERMVELAEEALQKFKELRGEK